MSWYRLYRPRTVAGLHLTSVRERLLALMDNGRFPQVLLFAGPKGTGKTSAARIIAAMLNDPANEAVVDALFFGKTQPKKTALFEPSESELTDSIIRGAAFTVQELDAASHRGIDDVRALKERVYLPPQGAKVSVYILDEVHMLTTEAFNALLKLLEEPPAHAVFILATTELHKIPATVASRATLIPFTKATDAEISQAIEAILKQEQIKTFDQAGLTALARFADGSFRDAVKLAENVVQSDQALTGEKVTTFFALSSDQELQVLVESVVNKDAQALTQTFIQLRQSQVDPVHFTRQLCQFLHQDLLKSLGVTEGVAVLSPQISRFLLQEISQLPVSTTSLPFLSLELKLLDLIFRAQQKGNKSSSGGTEIKQSMKTAKKTTDTSDEEEEVAVSAVSDLPGLPPAVLQSPAAFQSPATIAPADNFEAITAGDTAKLLEQWDRFVELVKDKNSSIAALLKSAQPATKTPGVAEVTVYYTFHKEQLQQPKFMALLDECVQIVTGGPIRFEFVLGQVTTADESASLSALAEELLV